MGDYASDGLIDIKPRRLDPMPRCANCQTGGLHHPLHRWGLCIVTELGRGRCPCTEPVLFHPEAARC
jgi:hypothetical protein